MIKYGIGKKELKKRDNKELVLTSQGFVRREKTEEKKSHAANKVARELAENRTRKGDKEILSHYIGCAIEDLESQEESNWRELNRINGGNKNE